MKEVTYYEESTRKPDFVFMKKMQALAKAYATWNKANDAVEGRIEKIGYDAVYDADGFKAADKAIDKLASAYNKVHGTDYTGDDFGWKGDGMQNAYFTALDHGLIDTKPDVPNECYRFSWE